MTQPAQNVVRSTRLIERLRLGKYASWFVKSDAESVEAGLMAVGELGIRLLRLLPVEQSPSPKSSYAEPVLWALNHLAMVRRDGSVDVRMPSGWPADLSRADPAFAAEFGERLAANRLAAWARNLDERSFAITLWMIGECGVRPITWLVIGKLAASVPAALQPGELQVMKEAEGLLSAVAHGARISVEEAARRLQVKDRG